jgi:UDP-glucose 4-epimerase
MSKKKWIVTGGAGFIGSHLVEVLIEKGDAVVCIDDFSTGKIKNLRENPLLSIVKEKIQEFDIKNIDYEIKGIFHLAAQVSVQKSISNMYKSSSNNLSSSLKVLEIAKLKKVPIVYASSSAIYGNMPFSDDLKNKFEILSPYALDKLSMEKYSKLSWDLYGVSSLGLRFFNVYGPRQDPSSPYSGVISIFLKKILNNKPVTLNGGHQTRDFIYVKDVCNILVKAMNLLFFEKQCGYYNLGTGKSITIKNLLELISGLLNVIPNVIYKNLPKGDPKASVCSVVSLENKMNFSSKEFTPIKKGIEETIKYLSRKTIKS